MTPTKKPDAEKRNAEREAALTFVRMAKEKGLDLTGPDGLLKQFTKSVLETALDEEMTEHLGRAKHKKSKDGRAANTRNGTTAKTVVTDSVGPVRIEVPRDRDGSFEPVVVRMFLVKSVFRVGAGAVLLDSSLIPSPPIMPQDRARVDDP